MTTDVLVVGSLHLDVVVSAPHLPNADETVTGTGVTFTFGGKGGNQAIAAARMGSSTEMVGRVGRDEFGRMLLAGLDKAGVQRSQVKESNAASGMSVAIVDHKGDYGAVIVSGANLTMIDASIDIHEGLRVLLLQNEIPEETNLRVASSTPDGTKTILNAAPMRRLDARLLSHVDVLVVNRTEAAQLLGIESINGEWVEIASRMNALGVGTVMITLGGDGLLICSSGEEARRVEAYPVEVASTHGAGDAFVGALASEIARGRSISGASRLAQAAAALHVSTNPDLRATITRNDVFEFMQARQPPSESVVWTA